MMPLGDLRQDQDGNYIALNVEQTGITGDLLKGRTQNNQETGEYPKATQQSTALRHGG